MIRSSTGVLFALLLAVSLALVACSGDEGTTAPDGTTTSTESGAAALTAEELAAFDGRDGRQAYVAVDGVVYDVTDSSDWPEGDHTVCNLGAMAGRNLSEEITEAPGYMRALLEKMPVVGTLVP